VWDGAQTRADGGCWLTADRYPTKAL
jgi:hypothetical protein